MYAPPAIEHVVLGAEQKRYAMEPGVQQTCPGPPQVPQEPFAQVPGKPAQVEPWPTHVP
jgi:hypothetical protein